MSLIINKSFPRFHQDNDVLVLLQVNIRIKTQLDPLFSL